jgi:hypothetical protein
VFEVIKYIMLPTIGVSLLAIGVINLSNSAPTKNAVMTKYCLETLKGIPIKSIDDKVYCVKPTALLGLAQ